MKNSDKMATMPVGKLLLSMGLPAVFSMLIQALYNIVDTMYISRFSQDALFAIGVITPLQMTGLAVALGGGAGVGTLVAKKLGAKNNNGANEVASTGFILTIIHTILIMSIGLLIAKPFIGIFTKRPEIIALGYSYLSIVFFFCFGQQFEILFQRTLQSQGHMIVCMISQLIGAITNIVLDPIFIFGFGFIPAMGIAGAAVATVAGQILSCLFTGYHIFFKKHEVIIDISKYKFNLDVAKEIYVISLPTMIMNAIGSLTTTLMNNVLIRFSEEAVSSLSMYFKLQSFIFMPVFGFNQGALPILSYNYGAQNRKRYLDTWKLFLFLASCCMGLGTILFRCFPELVLSFFEMDANLKAVSIVTISTISLNFLIAGCSIVVTTLFQSFGLGTTSMLQSLLRQIGVLIPLAYFLASFGRLELVWYAYPIAEFVVLVIFAPVAIKTFKNAFPVAE